MSTQKTNDGNTIQTTLSCEGKIFYDVRKSPFKIYGLIPELSDSGCFCRLPSETAKNVNNGVYVHHVHTSGGRVRFATDSTYIAIHAKMPVIGKMSHFAVTGSAGFDLYAAYNGGQEYVNTFFPPFDISDGFDAEFEVPSKGMREYTLNFPLYSSVSNLYIGLDENARLEVGGEYKHKKPVVYYGSSITQGGCASRPGNSYQSIISRRLDCDFTNLGFSGAAHGETAMAEYIAGLEMSAFVFDYDHNAETLDCLRETHEPMYKIIRDAQPTLPIICVSRPGFSRFDDSAERRQIILDTVNRAKAAGDENIFFIDGEDFYNEQYAGDSITVDGCHPNDLGFMCMASLIGRTVEKVL